MESLKVLINQNLKDFSDFNYYLPLIEKAIKNKELHPDICIETCKALLEGISKTIVERLDDTVMRGDLDNTDLSPLVKMASKLLSANDDQFENDFTTRCASLAYALGHLRNTRGDISHGRAVPKNICSGKDLALFSLQMTESILLYMLTSFFGIPIDKKTTEESQLLNYKDNPAFNDYLNEQYPLDGKIIYSEILYEKYYEDYKIKLSDYLYEEELLK